MRIPSVMRPLIVTVALASPASVLASETLSFVGSVSPGSLESVLPYSTFDTLNSDFDGEPLIFTAHVVGAPGSLYVKSFQLQWSAPTAPFMTQWVDGGGAPLAKNGITTADFVSSAQLDGAGGELRTTSSNYYVGQTDGSAALQLSYAIGGAGLTGHGRFTASLSQIFDPRIGLYDETVSIPFTLAGGVLTPAPEPAAWIMMTLGVAGLGWACRMRARRRSPGHPVG